MSLCKYLHFCARYHQGYIFSNVSEIEAYHMLLRSARQKPDEIECEFNLFTRFHTLCETYLSQVKLKTLIVNGLDQRIAETIRLAQRQETSIVELLDRARKQGATIHHTYTGAGSSIRMKTQPPAQKTRQKQSKLSFMSECPAGELEGSDALAYLDGYSMSTELLSSYTPTTSIIESELPGVISEALNVMINTLQGWGDPRRNHQTRRPVYIAS